MQVLLFPFTNKETEAQRHKETCRDDRCVCRKDASIPGSRLPGPGKPHLGARPTPLAPSGPLTPSCLGKPRAPALPPKQDG